MTTVLAAAVRLDRWLRARLGRPYGVTLTVGLVIETIHQLSQIPERLGSITKLEAPVLLLALDLALLLHQVAELAERVRPLQVQAEAPE